MFFHFLCKFSFTAPLFVSSQFHLLRLAYSTMAEQHLTGTCLNTGNMEWNSNRISLCDSRLHDHACVERYCCRWIIKQSVSGSCNLKRSSSPALPPQLISHLISTKIRLQKRGSAAFPVCVCMNMWICTSALVFVCLKAFSFIPPPSISHTYKHSQLLQMRLADQQTLQHLTTYINVVVKIDS